MNIWLLKCSNNNSTYSFKKYIKNNRNVILCLHIVKCEEDENFFNKISFKIKSIYIILFTNRRSWFVIFCFIFDLQLKTKIIHIYNEISCNSF